MPAKRDFNAHDVNMAILLACGYRGLAGDQDILDVIEHIAREYGPDPDMDSTWPPQLLTSAIKAVRGAE